MDEPLDDFPDDAADDPMPNDPELYQSAPVDLSNPGFDSVLDALRVVHEGTMPSVVLTLYHTALYREWEQSDTNLRAELAAHPDSDATRMALSSLALTKISLDAMLRYVGDPTEHHMAYCLKTYIAARRMNKNVRLYLESEGK